MMRKEVEGVVLKTFSPSKPVAACVLYMQSFLHTSASWQWADLVSSCARTTRASQVSRGVCLEGFLVVEALLEDLTPLEEAFQRKKSKLQRETMFMSSLKSP